MSEGEFTRENCDKAINQLEAMFKALSKTNQIKYTKHWTDIVLFLEEASKYALAFDVKRAQGL